MSKGFELDPDEYHCPFINLWMALQKPEVLSPLPIQDLSHINLKIVRTNLAFSDAFVDLRPEINLTLEKILLFSPDKTHRSNIMPFFQGHPRRDPHLKPISL